MNNSKIEINVFKDQKDDSHSVQVKHTSSGYKPTYSNYSTLPESYNARRSWGLFEQGWFREKN